MHVNEESYLEPDALSARAVSDGSEAFVSISAAAEAARQPTPSGSGPELTSTDFLSALAQLRELRAQIAAWEPDLIDAARHRGASWAQLAPALGVASRQAAERRYLRLRPPGTDADGSSTGDQRVQAERDRRAGQRAVDGWARDNASRLRQLAGQVSALQDHDGAGLDAVRHALGANDAADLLGPLAAVQLHPDPGHGTLAAQITAVGDQVAEVRRASDEGRRHPHTTR